MKKRITRILFLFAGLHPPSAVDLNMTQEVDGDLLKVMSWYDNEWGICEPDGREAVRMVRE